MAAPHDAEPHHGSYLDVSIHRDMLRDVVRTSAYADAIRALVVPGQRVIDFGSGTGVLAIFAARAGARVEAIERTAMAIACRDIVRRNGCPGVTVHHADHAAFRIDERVDVIISEWMGHALFSESMLEPLISLRERWLRPGGVMLPSRVALECALVTEEELYEEGSFLEHQPYGIDFGPIAALPLRQSRMVTLHEEQTMGPTAHLGWLDMHTIMATPERLQGRLVPNESGSAFGLLVWFDVELAPGITLGTGPHHPPTHWRQVFLPFPQPLSVTPQRALEIVISPPRDVEGNEPAWSWSVSDGESTIRVDERDTFMRSGRL